VGIQPLVVVREGRRTEIGKIGKVGPFTRDITDTENGKNSKKLYLIPKNFTYFLKCISYQVVIKG
jgi:hypothetical protein